MLDSPDLSKSVVPRTPGLQDRPSRRRFLRAAACASGSLIGAGRGLPSLAQSPLPVVPAHLSDTTGDGVLSAGDRRLVQRALFSRRGFSLRPNPEFDYRADVLGRGTIGQDALDLVSSTVAQQTGPLGAGEIRPITVAWHYGWYNTTSRVRGSQTVGFLGGDYSSSDSETESLFHELKNEFGITVDALSWIAPRDNAHLLDNYRRGYFQGAQVGTRHVALLYESTINLPRTPERIDFHSPAVQSFLYDDFMQMAFFLREIRNTTPARIFTLDGRPVVFLFGSHTWGLQSNSLQSEAIDQTVQAARQRFAEVYGTFPYLVGEEIARSFDTPFPEDRWRRLVNFDGVFSYHHVANMKTGPGVLLPLNSWYIENQVRLLRQTISSIRWVANRYSGHPILIIPSLASGFAKPGFPTLSVDRGSYADLIGAIRGVYMREYVMPYWGSHIGSPLLPAPVYTLGSWNEEFEGHSVFPSRFNLALRGETQRGFGIPMAIKQAFGWNHYAERDIGQHI